MGLFKQIKDMKQVVHAAPGMISQANEMAANAQVLQASQQGLLAQQMAAAPQAMAYQAAAAGATAPQPGNLEPIAGVTLQAFAEVSKGIAAYNYDQAMCVPLAAQRGISAEAWHQAAAGWNTRIQADPAVGVAFNHAYRGI